MTWDCNGGVPTSETDENSQVTNYLYANPSNSVADPLWRLLQTKYPDGGQKTITYNLSSTPPNMTESILINTVPTSMTTQMNMDGLGRVTQTQLTTDPDGADYTDITYNPLGFLFTQSNPHRTASSSTDGINTNYYDALGRTCLVVPPDGTLPTGGTCPSTQPANTVFSTYSGNCTTVTDQAAKSRKSCVDGLGRLTQVFEDPNASNLETDYTYDALNNLLTVNQKGGSTTSSNWRTRTFTNDSLSRLTQASNPESGTISYSYDADGNLLQKTSPAPNQTGTATVTLSYCYDALNRITGKAYTPQTCSGGLLPTPLVSYFYDQSSYNGLTITNGIGRRTGMSDQAGAEAWSYDVMGRTLADQRTTNGITKTTSYVYAPYVDGSVSTITYPTGRSLTYATGGAERLLSVEDNSNSIFYATGAHYAPPGGLAAVTNGTGIFSTSIYNSRVQPCWTYVTTGTALPWGAGTNCNTTGTAGNIMDLKYAYNLGVSDNGNVANITNDRDATRSQSFSYDSLNRLSIAQAAGGTVPNSNCWGLTFGYDPWGNLLQSSTSGPTGCGEPSPLNVTVNQANNQISYNTIAGQVATYCYDSAGNLIYINSPAASPGLACPTSSYQYTYDAENHLVNTANVTYTYDGDGKRVQKSNGKLYWYGTSSDPLAETDASGNTTADYVYFGGKRIAMVPTNAVSNGSFEVGVQGWSYWGTGIVAQLISTPSLCYSGNDCLQLSNSDSGQTGDSDNQLIPVAIGQTISLSAWVYQQIRWKWDCVLATCRV